MGDERLCVRGVTYGTFRPTEDGHELPRRSMVRQDLGAMAAHGIDAVRTYTVPPRWFLDEADELGLRVLVGIPAERYVGCLSDGRGTGEVEELVAAAVRSCAGHPAVLAFSVGNELPASQVRWHGRKRIENYLERLVRAVKGEDPEALATYVNYPSTEYLELPFLDLVCFNVYLERIERLKAYLERLHNIAGDRPLLMTELGLDSLRNGEEAQAKSLAAQVRTSFLSGCAGAFVYSWTDEWYRSGEDVHDWNFGLTRRDRAAKPALAAVQRAFAGAPFPQDIAWPRISVVVCTYNGSRTLRECLAGLKQLDYPDFEVIVVDDGSTDATADIARESGFRLVQDGRQGLSGARNSGLRAATGEIVAYIDDDAYPDSHWLYHLAQMFLTTDHVGVGGPNLPPKGDGLIAACISNSPGNPLHVLLSDVEAEHIPGCNMAFRREALEAIDGFDVRFQRAGDDVDICWRLRDRGWTLGFSAAAVVWHHRRGSVRAFWRQQFHYGAAEAFLEAKFPERYNSVGHHTWSGRVYGPRIVPLIEGLTRIYQGVWGSAPFQSLYTGAPTTLAMLPLMPEWFLCLGVLAGAAMLGPLWTPMYAALPLFVLALVATLSQAVRGGSRARFGPEASRRVRPALYALTSFLHLMQPFARLAGRLKSGLTPWRQRADGFDWPRPLSFAQWTERGRPLERWLEDVEEALRARGTPVARGGDFDAWDLKVRAGALGTARLLFGLEEHGRSRQLLRFRVWPSASRKGVALLLSVAGLSTAAGLAGAWPVAALGAAFSAFLLVRTALECGAAMHVLLSVVDERGKALGASPVGPGT